MVKVCPNCSEQVRDTDVYCPFCGGSIDYASQSTTRDSLPGVQSTDVICTNCGAVNKQGSKFCESCGFAVKPKPSFKDSSSGSVGSTTDFGSSSSSSQQTHSYGTYSTQPSDSSRKWYTPPKRERSAKNPLEWFFWTGWGLYVLIRAIFWILFFVLRIVARSRGRRF